MEGHSQQHRRLSRYPSGRLICMIRELVGVHNNSTEAFATVVMAPACHAPISLCVFNQALVHLDCTA